MDKFILNLMRAQLVHLTAERVNERYNHDKAYVACRDAEIARLERMTKGK